METSRHFLIPRHIPNRTRQSPCDCSSFHGDWTPPLHHCPHCPRSSNRSGTPHSFLGLHWDQPTCQYHFLFYRKMHVQCYLLCKFKSSSVLMNRCLVATSLSNSKIAIFFVIGNYRE